MSLPSTGAAPATPVIVPVLVDDAGGFLGTDLVITFDPAVASAASVGLTGISSPHTLATNTTTPGIVRIALYGTSPLAGAGALLDIGFTSAGPPGSFTPLAFTWADVNEGGVALSVVNGSYCVQGVAAPPGPLTMSRAPGSPVAGLTWTQHPWAVSYNVYRGSQGTLSDLACFQQGVAGVSTVDDGLVPPAGAVFYYLVTAATCAGESGAGQASSGAARVLPAPCG